MAGPRRGIRHSRLFDRIPLGNRGVRLANSALCAAGAGGDDRYRGASGHKFRCSPRSEASADARGIGRRLEPEVLRTDESLRVHPRPKPGGLCGNRVSGLFPEACRRTGTLERTRDNLWRSPSGSFYAPEGAQPLSKKGLLQNSLSCSRPHRRCEPPDRAATRAPKGGL